MTKGQLQPGRLLGRGETAIRLLARGASPGRAVVAGTGLDAVEHAVGRGAGYRSCLANLGTFERGTTEWEAESFLDAVGGDPVALTRVLDTFVDTPHAVLGRIETPTLVVTGSEDDHGGFAPELASALGDGRHDTVAGDHVSAMTGPALGTTIADFLCR